MTDQDDRTYRQRHDERRCPSPDYNRFYNDTHVTPWPGSQSHLDVSDCHPDLWDDPLYAIDDPYADFDQHPDSEKWWDGRPPRRKP